MDIDILREYLELAKDPNISRTARRLNMSQSALSAHVIKLEKDLGVRLIDRGVTNVLSPEGKVFLEYAMAVVDTYDEGKQKCRTSYNKRSTTVSVHKFPAPIVAGNYLIKEVFAFKKAHPDITVHLIEDEMSTTRKLIQDKRADIGIAMVSSSELFEPLVVEGFEYFPFHREETAIWVSRDSALATKEPLSPRDLDGYTSVSIDSPLSEERELVLRSLADCYGVQVRNARRSFFSAEEFYLSDFKPNEYVRGLVSRFEMGKGAALRDDMVVRTYTEPIYGVSYIGYRADDNNPALLELVKWLKEHTHLE